MKFFTKEVKIALVAIVAIVILYVGMQFLKGLSLFSNDETYYIRFSNVSGLATSSPVYANGYRVGVVRTIDYDYSRPDCIIASFDLDPKMQLHEGTRAEIVSDFMGNVKLELQLGAVTGRLLAKGDTIEGGLQVQLCQVTRQRGGVVEHPLCLVHHLWHLPIQLCGELVQLAGGGVQAGRQLLCVLQGGTDGRVGDQRLHAGEDGVELRQQRLHLRHHLCCLRHQSALQSALYGVALSQQAARDGSQLQLQLDVAHEVAHDFGAGAFMQLHLRVKVE